MPSRDVSAVLIDLAQGRARADELLPLVYAELKAMARAQMARLPAGQTLQPTALVHDAFLRLVGKEAAEFQGRAHFFGAAAQAMRGLLVDALRRKQAQKRGGGALKEELDEADAIANGVDAVEVLAVDAALKKLERDHPRRARVVLLRYFAGLTAEETAQALEVDTRTVERAWTFARAWLKAELEGGEPLEG
ncbi:MAG: sigma-70 family RNA polymerase sigma factor, partial [Deltaproteobacteria bacterium]|nr:sigma-70 family RNA polymerase sigma factor [Deltaproteobacteria bacterium]